MDKKEILDIVSDLLPKEIRDNKSFKKVVSEFRDALDDINITTVNVREDIVEKDRRLQSESMITPGQVSSPVLFSMLSRDCEFVVEVSNIPMISFNMLKSLGEDYQEEIDIEIIIRDCSTTRKDVKYHTNRSGYYFDYEADMSCYNKDGDEVELENKEHFLDDDFAGIFGISIEDARECRLNFDQYADSLNEIKVQIYLDGVDEMEGSIFLPPFSMSDLGVLLTGMCEDPEEEGSDKDDGETYEEEADEEAYDEDENGEESEEIDDYIDEGALENVGRVKEELVNFMGEEGQFIMSRSIFYNINDYVKGRVLLLAIKGMFVRKLNGEYTVFYVSITNDSVICIPKKVSPKEAKKLYDANRENQYIEGLDDFFGISKRIDFKPKKRKE